MLTESSEFIVVGAGPAGLRAAQVLAEAGREVVVAERHVAIGPKTCAGGLTAKAVRELTGLGLPRDLGLTSVPTVSHNGGAPIALGDSGVVRTVSRARLGALQAEWARRAGAAVETGADVRDIDLPGRRVRIGGRTVRYRHLIGADGSTSRVRIALGLPVSRAYFAGEFNVPGEHAEALLVALDPARLATGYFWIFPHVDYTSIGAGAPTHLVRPASVRRYIEARLDMAGLAPRCPFEGATIEVQFVGFHFPDGVHLVGDAAGVASPITGEGIYAALVTGEEVARQILDPTYPAIKTRAWLRLKRLHDGLGRAWRSRPVRAVSFAALVNVLRVPVARTCVTSLFVGG